MRKGRLFKRSVAVLLSVALLLGAIGTDALAASADPVPNNRTSYDTDMETEINAVNSVGNLIKNTLESGTDNKESEEGYDIIDLSIERNLATVEYDTLEDAEIVVALYAEGTEPLQMLASGKADAIKDEHIVQVTIESDSIPDYFIAKAFLLRKASHSPLCNAYTSNLYTRELQELQEKTTADFNENRILNLDEDETTNYAVYSADTKIIDEQSGKNRVKDNGDGTYTVTNADTSFTGLKKGDVFSYNYDDGTVLVVKVASIQVDGMTVMITEDKEAELSDAFDYVKIEGRDDGANVTVDDSNLEEGVTYEGEEAVSRSRAIDIGGSISKKFNLNLSYKVAQGNGSVEITGGIEFGIKTDISLYISLSYQHIEIRQEFPVSISVELSGSLEKKFKLVSFTVSPVAGLYIHFTPSVVLRASGKLKYEIGFTTVIGFSYDNKKGLVSKCSSPRITKSKLSAKVSLYVGLSLSPDITIISESIAKADLSADIGIEAALQKNLSEYDSSKIHRCKNCIEGELLAKGKISVNANLANLKVSATLYKISNKISDFYYSADQNEFGFTTCPYYDYKVTLTALDPQQQPVANAKITDTRLLEYGVTDEKGKAVLYLPNGQYFMNAANEQYEGYTNITVKRKAKTVTLYMDAKMPTSGTCGSNLTWELDESGTLYVRGTGEMDDYLRYSSFGSPPPWDSRKIKNIVVENGVTSIGNEAFSECDNLNNVSLPKSITRIGGAAFVYSLGLTHISIPDKVTCIEGGAFAGCENLSSISIPDSVTTIEWNAFSYCYNLKDITIPDNVTYIGDNAFAYCKSLTTISLPAGVTRIEDGIFCCCYNLSDIKILGKITYIGSHSFTGTNLSSFVIPSGITIIKNGAFSDCKNLNNISIPKGVTIIEDDAFLRCKSLRNVTIPNTVTRIDGYAFMDCTNLTNITLPGSLTSIGNQVFDGCKNLQGIYFSGNVPSFSESCFYNVTTTVYYPASNTTWTEDVRSDYGGTITWTTYDGTPSAASYEAESGTNNSNNSGNPPDETTTEGQNTQDEQTGQTGLETETAITYEPIQYYDNTKAPLLKAATYSTTVADSCTASSQDRIPNTEYLLAVVRDENAGDLLSADNLLYIDQTASDENGTISLSYLSKDGTSGSERFFGLGNQQDLDEFIAKILSAQPDDLVQAEEGIFLSLPATALNAASRQQVYLGLPAGNNVHWEIDGKSIPLTYTQDIALEIARTGKQNGQISEDTITEIAGKYNAEQLNLPKASLPANTRASLKVGVDASLADWKCIIFQCNSAGENKLTEYTLIKNNEVYVNSIQGENYLLIYSKNGDVSGDKKVNMTDLMKILYHVSGRAGLNTLEQSIADINLDKNTNMTDLMKVLYYVSGRNTDL